MLIGWSNKDMCKKEGEISERKEIRTQRVQVEVKGQAAPRAD